MFNSLVEYFQLQRKIFCLCPKCHAVQRLSEFHLYLKNRPSKDWMDDIEEMDARLEAEENQMNEKKQEILTKSRELGRHEADEEVRKLDTIFSPRNMNADEAKVVFHPIDYIVFQGMKSDSAMEKLVLLDRKRILIKQKKIQDSIKMAVNKKRYEWQTLRVDPQGQISIDLDWYKQDLANKNKL